MAHRNAQRNERTQRTTVSLSEFALASSDRRAKRAPSPIEVGALKVR
jgi:hypothetical protein